MIHRITSKYSDDGTEFIYEGSEDSMPFKDAITASMQYISEQHPDMKEKNTEQMIVFYEEEFNHKMKECGWTQTFIRTIVFFTIE